MEYELWKELNGGFTFSTKKNIKDMINRGIISNNSKKVWEINAKTWEEAMSKYHEYMGWNPYILE